MPEQIPTALAKTYWNTFKDQFPSAEAYVQSLEKADDDQIEGMADYLYNSTFANRMDLSLIHI